MGYLLLWLFGSIIVGGIGAERTCGFLRGFFLSLFLTPIIGGIMVALCPKKKSTADMLAEAKIMLDTGAATKEEYEAMISDITTKGKMKNLRSYKKGIIDPLKH